IPRASFPFVVSRIGKEPSMERRLFIKSALASSLAIGAQPVNAQDKSTLKSAIRVAADKDRLDKPFHLPGGIGLIHCKVSTQDTNGALFLIEHANMGKGGPLRHLHHDQDEWFYAIEGEYVAEVGDQKFRLKPGDSLLAPRKVPHVWAHVDDKP